MLGGFHRLYRTYRGSGRITFRLLLDLGLVIMGASWQDPGPRARGGYSPLVAVDDYSRSLPGDDSRIDRHLLLHGGRPQGLLSGRVWRSEIAELTPHLEQKGIFICGTPVMI